jgi:GNAT superfamily N-acetyltransferase
VNVHEWDPATAPAAEVEGMVRLTNEVLAHDLPNDPPWRPDGCREYLAVTMPGERRICWIATAESAANTADTTGDQLIAAASVLLTNGLGVFELIVHPRARRSGVGTTLLAAAARRAYDEGFDSLGVEVVGETPGVAFYEAHGFRCAYIEMRNVLDLSTVDWFRLGEMAGGVGSGYRIEYHPGGPPESMFPTYAAAKTSVRDSGPELDLRPSSYEPERLRASLETLHARQLKPYIVLAVHEATDTVAGLTEVVVPAHRPSRADQYDTIVVPAHRGYGLGRALKARMLFELRAAEPQLLEVQTWHGTENEPLLKVNAELGFLSDRQWREYEGDVATLVDRLSEST